jgi:enamine deaminase RidA (YjgF/YER057c/UK114 family)
MADIKRLAPGARLSGAVVHGDTVYLAGTVADGPTAKAQTEAILRKFDELLAQAGSDKTKLLTATIYVADMRYYDEMNAAWDAWIPRGHTPARATVEAKLAQTKYLVEIAAIAAI